jgi:hypothetical protein
VLMARNIRVSGFNMAVSSSVEHTPWMQFTGEVIQGAGPQAA